MSRVCRHGNIMGECPLDEPFRPNVDKRGLARDFATYEWLLYGPGKELPPDRTAFLYGVNVDPPRLAPSRDTR